MASATCAVIGTLRVGSTGSGVQCLQSSLGINADGKFGPVTRDAVLAFQTSKGLVADGVFGPKSNAVLAASVADDLGFLPSGCTPLTTYSPTTGVKCDNTAIKNTDLGSISIPTNNNLDKNPNLVNSEKFIAAVIKINKEKGGSEKELAHMEGTLRDAITKSDLDFTKEFEELLTKEAQLSIKPHHKPAISLVNTLTTKVLSFLGIAPRVAQATGLPFGGAVYYTFFCAANGSWMIGVTPLPPTYVSILSYYPGTQGFASYNIPFTRFLLGTYEPVGVCIVPGTPPVVFPTEGTITPVVGSSPL